MAKPGPKPKPTALRVLEGDHHKSRYNFAEPDYGAFVVDDIPERVARDPEALGLWRYLAPKLSAQGILQDADRPAFELLCVHYGLWALKPSLTMGKGVMAMLAEFGITPSSRSRIVGKPHKEMTPLEQLVAPRKRAT